MLRDVVQHDLWGGVADGRAGQTYCDSTAAHKLLLHAMLFDLVALRVSPRVTAI